ncbi:hypothetical protein NM208_g1932 [Fusarium decemcellulare]|uniref:Uncharacterized protein n=2 Tax=Fusarium decemcellulare TaxID=57161 RepID=A0ACC1SCM4_9HYPO|nr:hypothetical protein NM208_g6549 [Fusarium decemcellulare]KAJ3546594.1 hypothetical protein NM208_g1932 [Fusarium decemcellulare]
MQDALSTASFSSFGVVAPSSIRSSAVEIRLTPLPTRRETTRRAMALPSFRLVYVYLGFLIPRAWEVLCDKVRSWIHRLTYRAVEPCQNVVVIGGSFGGIELTRKLAHSLPTGYRVVLIEKNSHFNYPFNFPRYSVLQGHEHLSFIPYNGIVQGAPKGIYRLIRGEAKTVNPQAVVLASGEKVPYAYLVVATGAAQRPPARMMANDGTEAQSELRNIQKAIETAARIAVIGAGAVGVELATDIKSYYPDKLVTLIHSRERLLPRFPGVHEEVLVALDRLGVDVILGERPQLPPPKETIEEELEQDRKQTLLFADGRAIDYDLIVRLIQEFASPASLTAPPRSLALDSAPTLVSSMTSSQAQSPTPLVASSHSLHSR